MADQTPPVRRARPVARAVPELKPKVRVASTVLGLLGVGAGGAAVFLRDVEAGPVALIVFGTLFLLIAVIGRPPVRAKFGDNEFVWPEEEQAGFGEAVAELEQIAPKDDAEVQEAIENAVQVSPVVEAAYQRAANFNQDVLDVLRLMDSTDGLQMSPQTSWDGAVTDALVVNAQGARIGIETVIRADAARLVRERTKAIDLFSRGAIDAYFIVAKSIVNSKRIYDALAGDDRIFLISASDLDVLGTTLRRQLNRVSPTSRDSI